MEGYSIIQSHVPFLGSFSFDDLMVAVERHKNATPPALYAKPRLEHVFPYLTGDQIEDSVMMSRSSQQNLDLLFKSQSYEKLLALERASPKPDRHRMKEKHHTWGQVFDTVYTTPDNEEDAGKMVDADINELRLSFIEILRSSYYHQIENGSLEEFGDLTYSLFQGLDFCENTCATPGHPLNDWEATRVASDTQVVLANRMFVMVLRWFKQLWRRERKCCGGLDLLNDNDPTNFKIRFLVRQNLAFVRAHRHAQEVFKDRFTSNPGMLSPAERIGVRRKSGTDQVS